jgi:threonine dehydrogenase-like Zn-dependent dehydrogenase
MPNTVLAAVQLGPERIELQEFPRPEIGPDEGLLRLEACGICGSDIEQFRGHTRARVYPVIPGHEPLGIVEEIGERAALRWGVRPGDRVVVEARIPCGACPTCLSGRYTLCPAGRIHGSNMPTSVPPAIWGGFAQYMYLHPNSIPHKVAADIPTEIAVLHNPLAAGISWAVVEPGTRVGDTVVVLGAGQRGLCCVIAARTAGARTVIVTGLGKDRKKLELARALGADHAINVDEEDAVARVREITGGELADVVVDAASGSPQLVLDAIAVVKPGGTILLAGTKGRTPIQNLYTDEIVHKSITIKGSVGGVDVSTFAQANSIIESGRFPLERLHTHSLLLKDAAKAIEILAGNVPGEESVHVAVVPGRS